MMFASKALPDRFPYRVGAVRVAYQGTVGGVATVYDPREHDASMNNEPNPILVGFRMNNADSKISPEFTAVATPEEWLRYSENAYIGPEVHMEHARKVLSRLAALS